MSLQGSFQTIALPDVMALLSSSSKSGELRVVGGHTEGKIWFQDGQLVASAVGKARNHVDAVFELLRLSDGSFVFRDGVEAPESGEPATVGPVVTQAAERLQEWREIEAVVPSLDHRVQLVAELPGPEVTLSAPEWQLVIAVALAGTARGVVEELDVSYFEGCRGIKWLVDAGLVVIEPPRVRGAADTGRAGRRGGAAGREGSGDFELPADSAAVETARQTAPDGVLVAATASSTAARADTATGPTAPVSSAEERQPALLASVISPFNGLGDLVAPQLSVPASESAVPAGESALAFDAGHSAAERVQIPRHDEDDADEDGPGLAVVRHLFLAPAEPSEAAPAAFDWEAWKKAAAAVAEDSASPASIRSIHSAPSAAARASTLAETANVGGAGSGRWLAPEPTAPTAAPATGTVAPTTTPVTTTSEETANVEPTAKPAAPEAINRGLLLKFLSSVRS